MANRELVVTIELENDAFEDAAQGEETARILRGLADVVEVENRNFSWINLYDMNGNYVGMAQVREG